jgi:UrcA family protein
MNIQKRNTGTTSKVGEILAVALCAAFFGNALAATPSNAPPRQVVGFSDLNLRGPKGISVLYQRIEAAAHVVCDSASERELAQVVRWHLCLDQAIARAVSDLSIPALTSYHLAKNGRSEMPVSVAKQP